MAHSNSHSTEIWLYNKDIVIIYLYYSDAILQALYKEFTENCSYFFRRCQSDTAEILTVEWKITLLFLTFLKLGRASNEASLRHLFQGFVGHLPCQQQMHRGWLPSCALCLILSPHTTLLVSCTWKSHTCVQTLNTLFSYTQGAGDLVNLLSQ